MANFVVSLTSSVQISATVSVSADNEQDAIAKAIKLQSQSKLLWQYNGIPISSFRGPISSIWASPPPPSAREGIKKVSALLAVGITTLPFGTPNSATVTIAPGATGTVNFYADLLLLGSATPDVFGIASLPDFNLPIGLHEIYGNFEGDENFAPSISKKILVNVTSPATSASLVVTPNPALFGNQIELGALVTSGINTPTGLVIFFDGENQIGSGFLSEGAVIIYAPSLSIGTHPIIAKYQGNSDFAPSISNPVNVIIHS